MIKILTFAMLVGSLSIASANHHEEETITLDNLADAFGWDFDCLLYTSPSPRDDT